jgi:16S rRNA G527 N7-methylase RsmG
MEITIEKSEKSPIKWDMNGQNNDRGERYLKIIGESGKIRNRIGKRRRHKVWHHQLALLIWIST